MDLSQRRQWSENHKKLTGIILKPLEHNAAIELFLSQHSLLHASETSHSAVGTLEDELLTGLREETIRKYPVVAPDTKNSIAWHIWHITRIEDMTMNVLVHQDRQVFHAGDWRKRLKVDFAHSGNEMAEDEIAYLSANIDIAALLAYRMEVGRKTRDVVSGLRQGEFKQKVEAESIRALKEQEAVKEEASWLLDYWGGKTLAGLILMPATRHIFVHLNKSIRIKQRLQK
ncbi:MAG: DinB family protein [Cohnella sp.]|nr:DinB family protein [Cohnella sp.]